MLDALKFVKGAVAKKDIVPALTHFHVGNGVIKGYNGRMALCSPIALDLECQPKAVPFIKAIEACKGTVQLSLTPTGRLSIRSGSFKAFVDCDPGSFPDIEPEGDKVALNNGGLLDALKSLEPIIGEDASRPWCRGILFRGPSAFATNNIILAEYWLGYNFLCDLNIPHEAVNELIRIGKEPVAMQVCPSSVTFHYEDGRWLRTQTLSTEWPDVARVLGKELILQEVPSNFFESVNELLPFVNRECRLYFMGNRLATEREENEGASIEVQGIPHEGCFNLNQVRLLEGLVKQIDFHYLPNGPIMFTGDRVRGAIVGIRTV